MDDDAKREAGGAPSEGTAGEGALPIVCLAVGDLYGLADLYIARLQGMLARHCGRPFRLHCYSDRPRTLPACVALHDCARWTELERAGMRPTTRKLGLFNPAYMPFEEFLYLDLTLVIRAGMAEMLEHALRRPEALVIVQDWNYDGYNSSVMRVRPGGPLRAAYDAFVAGERFEQKVPGDQDFLRGVIRRHGLQSDVALFAQHLVVSFKQMKRLARGDPEQARRRLQGATIVKFHGAPKMHEALRLRYRLEQRLRELRRGQLRPVLPLAELGRHWQGGAQA